MNLCTNFRDLLLTADMAPRFQYMYSVLFAFKWRLMLPAACSKPYSRDSAWADIFARSSRSIFRKPFLIFQKNFFDFRFDTIELLNMRYHSSNRRRSYTNERLPWQYIYIYIYIRIFIHIYVYAWVCVWVGVNIYIHMYIYNFIYISRYLYIHIYIYIYIYIHVNIYYYIHVYSELPPLSLALYIYIYIYTHSYLSI